MRIRQVLLLGVVISSMGLTGCASIVDGTHQRIFVKTPPVKDARCLLSNSKGHWIIPETPGAVKIHRDYGSLDISCHKYGYKSAHRTVQSNTKGMVFGNAVFGGFLGAGVDMADGAAYHYPSTVIIPMHRVLHKGEKQHGKK